jgi:hypothetical protein
VAAGSLTSPTLLFFSSWHLLGRSLRTMVWEVSEGGGSLYQDSPHPRVPSWPCPTISSKHLFKPCPLPLSHPFLSWPKALLMGSQSSPNQRGPQGLLQLHVGAEGQDDISRPYATLASTANPFLLCPKYT